MGQPNIKEIEASLQDWELLKQLPPVVGDFKLVPSTGIAGQILNLGAYVDEKTHCRLDLTYTSETFDYVPVKTVGLHVFRDERYFHRDREKFGQQLLAELPLLLSSIDRGKPHAFGCEAKTLGFEKWDYWRKLPARIGDYELFITPENPLEYLNGSYIFLDYTDFQHGNQLYFAYNIYRNELFAEKKKGYFPLTTDVFDVNSAVKDERKLELLGRLLDAHLERTLQDLEKT